ncbi:hypothetical protein GN244_ATG20010 [Phytophthora infestans]|uniref:Uncharacterized protein n=1 Tax=Phytophthora infestans TaxID=4787 RepID=A0A833SKC2_PHYIN|nr:hypothetical protein GN244_ATG20010 [Phytophthora infestans]KAF4137287.1 hypothetical protein GN958_ATG13550 [Phytophthora infestans]
MLPLGRAATLIPAPCACPGQVQRQTLYRFIEGLETSSDGGVALSIRISWLIGSKATPPPTMKSYMKQPK